MNKNVAKHLQNPLTYFSKGGYDFEVIDMTGDENVLIVMLIASKNGERVRIKGGNPIRISNPLIHIEENGEEVENPREAFKEMIYSLVDGS